VASGDLTDAEWELIGPLLSVARGRPGHENRRLLDGILWRAREGARWRAIPERYGRVHASAEAIAD
jgi:transposase